MTGFSLRVQARFTAVNERPCRRFIKIAMIATFVPSPEGLTCVISSFYSKIVESCRIRKDWSLYREVSAHQRIARRARRIAPTARARKPLDLYGSYKPFLGGAAAGCREGRHQAPPSFLESKSASLLRVVFQPLRRFAYCLLSGSPADILRCLFPTH